MRGIRVSTSIFLLTASAFAFSQTPDTATLRGRVLDPSQASVAGVSVSVHNTATGLSRTVVSDGHGGFTVESLPVAGEYDVTTAKDGFAPVHLEHVKLAAGSTARVDVHLNVSSESSTVTVEGTAEDVNLTEPAAGIRLNPEQIEATPLLNRRITYLALLNAANRPAINQGDIFMNQNLFTTNGGGRRQQAFVVDGSNGNDSWGRQTIFTNIPEDAVAEMDVLTQSFSAEYGASTGSVVNIVTKSGSDKLHGSVIEVYRPGDIGARYAGFTGATTTSGNQISSDQLAQTAASISGKLLKNDPTYFFFAGEFSRQRRTSTVNAAALTPGPFVGHYRDLLGDLRLDRQMSTNNNAFLRINADGFYDTNPNGIVGGATLPSVARTFYRRTYSIAAGDTAVLSPHLVNNLRAQFQLASPITQFVPVTLGTQYSVPIPGANTFTSGTSQSALLMNRQYGINEALSIKFGKHQLVAGGDWLLAHTGGNSKEFGGPYFLGRFVYKPCQPAGLTGAALIAYCESSTYLNDITNVATYTQGYGNPSYTVTDNLFAIFAQDDYNMTDRLTINLGLRYEQQTFTDARKNFGPRAGFVYDPRGTGQTVVRGGFGIYYSQIVDNSQANYVLSGPQYVNYTASPGQVGFPTSVASAPLPALAAGAAIPLLQLYVRPGNSAYLNQFFPTSVLPAYPSKLLNPYSEQYTFGVEQRLAANLVLDIDYVGTHTVHNVRPLDIDAPTSFIRTAQGQTRATQAADCTRPLWVYYYQQEGLTCTTTSARSTQPAYNTIQTDSNDGYAHYNSLNVNLKYNLGRRASFLASYVWSHTLNNVDPDTTSQNPNDANLTNHTEYGNAIFDQRNRAVVSGYYVAPFGIQAGGILTLAGGLPYNLVTGTTNSGDTGATTDRPVINGVVVGRNVGRGTPIYGFDPFVARDFRIHEGVHFNLRAEAFNVANHANYIAFIGAYGNAAAPATLGLPSKTGINSQLAPREFQFEGRLSF